jgi:hypothetical protein
MPDDFFRGQGIDLVAFFNRLDNLYYFSKIWHISITKPRLYYTDGESVFHVYLGLGLLLVVPLFIVFWKKLLIINKLLLLSGIITFFLSLGPSLKINNHRNNSEIKTKNISFNDYLMPKEKAVLLLPYSMIYKVSPFKYMRSVSRWLLLTILALVISLMVLLTLLWNYNVRGKVLSVLILIWIIIEYYPNYNEHLKIINRYTNEFNLFNSTALADFKNNIKTVDTVLFIQNGGLKNEYFSTYLCSNVECKTYNVSGDKALLMAEKKWPKEVYNATLKPNKESLYKVLNSKYANVLVIPHFDMRWNSYFWPPQESTLIKYNEFALQLKSENVDVINTKWFSYFRLKN